MDYNEQKKLVDLPLEEIAVHHNLAELMSPEDLKALGECVLRDYQTDARSRENWLNKKYKKALELATQTWQDKSYPWPNASNVKFPLLTIAGIRFHAMAYPSLLPSNSLVTGKVIGKDELGVKKDRAERIALHMSYQFLEQMEEWEEGMDRLLITLPFTGTEFKKTYFDPERGTNVSQHVFAKDLVVNYFAKTIETAPRVTEILSLYKNEILEKQRFGIFRKFQLDEPAVRKDTATEIQDKSKGVDVPNVIDDDTPYFVLEQHRYYDLDGDGYKEPYICTVVAKTGQVLRIVARFEQDDIIRNDEDEVVYVNPTQYYTAFIFIPNPAGGIYGMGFGDLLGPLNHSVDTIINQLVDAGTMSNLQSGFISRNLRIKGGNYKFKPNEWMSVNASGQDLKAGILPLPTREPSTTLFSLLQFLVNAGERLASTTDLQVGENPGQNQKAQTTMVVQQNGMRVFTAIYKRIRKAMEKEFKKVFELNKHYLQPREYFTIVSPTAREMQTLEVKLTDYQAEDVGVIPSADPTLASMELKMARAQFLASLMTMGGFNEYAVKRRLLEAGEIERPDEVLPDPSGPAAIPPAPNPDMIKLQLEGEKEQNEEKEREFRRNYDMAKLQVEAKGKEIELEIAQQNANTDKLAAQGDIANTAAKVEVENKKASQKATKE